MNDTDKAVSEGARALRDLFCRLDLSPEEKAFVNDSARKLADYAFELLTSLPEERAQSLRPIVMAVAIACIIGPPQPGDFGTDILSGG